MTVEERGRAGAVPCPEGALGLAAAKLLAILAIPVMAGSAAVAGVGGALGAAAGLALVLGLFGVSGAVLAALPKAGPSLVVGVSLGAVGVRLLGYAAALAALAPVDVLHRPSLAVATAVAIAATLVHELRVVSRTPGFFWVDASSGGARQGAG